MVRKVRRDVQMITLYTLYCETGHNHKLTPGLFDLPKNIMYDAPATAMVPPEIRAVHLNCCGAERMKIRPYFSRA